MGIEDLKDMFQKKEAEYRCIKPGWIKLIDFVEKYFSQLNEQQKIYKHNAYRKIIKKFPESVRAKAGRATYVEEFAFCLFVHVDFIKDGE